MAILLNSIKGEPLTAREIDQNMAELDCRIKTLEDLAQAETAITVENVHDALVFKNGLGIEVGRAILPKWMPRVRGEWQLGEVYVFGDWVRFEGSLYFCIAPHIVPYTVPEGEMAFDKSKWELLIGE
ncbi:MAG: hypothetical protein V4482_03900 [Pseudomonadota bacterium]